MEMPQFPSSGGVQGWVVPNRKDPPRRLMPSAPPKRGLSGEPSMPPEVAPQEMKMIDSPLLKGAKPLGLWGLSCWRLPALAHGTTP